MRSVVKHKYLKGKFCRSKAKAHVKYLEHRDGPDRPQGGRKFFSANEDGISGRQIRQEINSDSPLVVHKLVLSPGVDGVDMKAYTREVMSELERQKGLELNWRAVDHQNTDHGHGHVLLYAPEGQRVSLTKNDYKIMRAAGDRYLERAHNLERYLREPQLEKVLEGPGYEREGDRVYQGLIDDVMAKPRDGKDLELDPEEKKKKLEREAQDIEEHRKLDKEITNAYKPATERQQGKGKEQRMQEGRGQLTEAHLDYGHAKEIKELQDQALQFPDKAEEIQKQIEVLKAEHLNLKQEVKPWREFDVLIGYDLDHIQEREQPDTKGPQLPDAKDPLAEALEAKGQEQELDSVLDGAYKTPLEDFDYSSEDEQTEVPAKGKEKDRSADSAIGVKTAEYDSDAMGTEATDMHLQQEFFENTEPSREEPEIDDGFDRGLG